MSRNRVDTGLGRPPLVALRLLATDREPEKWGDMAVQDDRALTIS